MKKIFVYSAIIFSFGAIIAGCSNQNKKQGATADSTLSSEKNVSKSSESIVKKEEAGVASTNSESVSSKEVSTESTSPESINNDEEYPYEVSIEQLVTNSSFYKNGVNIPKEIFLSLGENGQGIISFATSTPEKTVETSYTIAYQKIPTKKIRVATDGTNEIRTVNVNTELVLGAQQNSDDNREMGGNLYAFIAYDGGIRLATPNYAGNVLAGDEDVMLEYLVK